MSPHIKWGSRQQKKQKPQRFQSPGGPPLGGGFFFGIRIDRWPLNYQQQAPSQPCWVCAAASAGSAWPRILIATAYGQANQPGSE